MTVNSNHADNDTAMGLTTPSSTQASSPIASPALSLTDDRKRNKSESDENQSQRNRFVLRFDLIRSTMFSRILDRIQEQIKDRM